MFRMISSFCNLWILNIVWFPLLSVNGYLHLISLISWEMHTLWRNSYYIGLLNFSSHFGNRYQWGRSLESLREFGFYAFVAFAFNTLASLQGCFIHYINPLKKGLSSITKMGEIESAWLPPCVVLVINDNPYGLIFALSSMCRLSFSLCQDHLLIKAKLACLHWLESRSR